QLDECKDPGTGRGQRHEAEGESLHTGGVPDRRQVLADAVGADLVGLLGIDPLDHPVGSGRQASRPGGILQSNVQLRREEGHLLAVAASERWCGHRVALGVAGVAEVETGADDTDHTYRRLGAVDRQLIEAPGEECRLLVAGQRGQPRPGPCPELGPPPSGPTSGTDCVVRYRSYAEAVVRAPAPVASTTAPTAPIRRASATWARQWRRTWAPSHSRTRATSLQAELAGQAGHVGLLGPHR